MATSAASTDELPVYPFDSHKFVTQLQYQGFSAEQAEAVLDAFKSTMAESLEMQHTGLATKADHLTLKSELSERVFNTTLKFDIAQRHMKEILDRDFNNLKQEIRIIEKGDFDKVLAEIMQVEKKFMLHKQQSDTILNKLTLANETLERRIFQYAVRFGAAITVVLAFLGTYFEKS
ncbi:hypothetical protein SPRG_05657 [Saprolegnia parasitica CBS 223.65]|uniref:DUF1640 domain-containing protein n=1 Tax=Saprolegnia parasitica (strain CBS 223.65) TaxID=695850 RepID=A0A067CT68_SAPPC|nr:hypothetical protein SPRG_05657 [Saprolegnia parasitica CBS 223.65]KDO29706.1 hypothetical protein SPRG_05657 [Saprolegnia parasitica CBS 223.65]|eukprot:XP_012199762.1 hypothetical protein SPRG_05657 [Saprolegnia parasitica CBS 223.65]